MDAIDVKWLNDEQKIIHYHFQKGWQWNDLDEAFKAAWHLMDTVQHKVDVILDFTDATMSVPGGALTHGRRIFGNKPHSNLRLTVLVGNRFISQLTETARRFLPRGLDQWDLRFAASFEQAQGMVKERSEHDKPVQDTATVDTTEAPVSTTSAKQAPEEATK